MSRKTHVWGFSHVNANKGLSLPAHGVCILFNMHETDSNSNSNSGFSITVCTYYIMYVGKCKSLVKPVHIELAQHILHTLTTQMCEYSQCSLT